MSSEQEKKKLVAKEPVNLDATICIEWFRLVAFFALTLLFAFAAVFSKQFVFFKDDDEFARSLLRGVDGDEADEGRRLGFVLFGQEHPYLHMKDTVIYKTFGLPHTCSYIDFNPAKEVGAILLPFFTFPMTIFLILAHYRNQLVYVNLPESASAKDLYWYSRVTTYFSVACIQLCHLWFVNDPEEVYPKAFGFVGHYIPYAMFQASLIIVAIMQVKYDITTKVIPFNVSEDIARLYVKFLVFLTLVYQTIVIAILVDNPVIDARNGGWELTFFTVLVKVYALTSLVIPVVCSIWTIKNSGDTNSFRMAIQ